MRALHERHAMRPIVLAAAMLLATSCGPFVYRIDVQQGNVVTQETVSQLKPGMSKTEVRQVLGTPLLSDVFHANRWDYYFSKSKGGRAQERQVVSLFFKDDKLVEVSGDVKPAAPKPAAAAPAAPKPAAPTTPAK